MAIEAKLGMFIIMILVGAFGFLVYRRVDMHQQQLLAVKGGESPRVTALENVEPFESPGQFTTGTAATTDELDFTSQFTEPVAEAGFDDAAVAFGSDSGFAASEASSAVMDVDPFDAEVVEQPVDEPNSFEPNSFDPNAFSDTVSAGGDQAADDPFAGEFGASVPDSSVAANDEGLLFDDATSAATADVGFEEPAFFEPHNDVDVATLEGDESELSFGQTEVSSLPEEEPVPSDADMAQQSFTDDADSGWQSASSAVPDQDLVAGLDEQTESLAPISGPLQESFEADSAPRASDDLVLAQGNASGVSEFQEHDSSLSFDDRSDGFHTAASDAVPDMTIAMLDDDTRGDFGGSLATSPFDVEGRKHKQDDDVAADNRMVIPQEPANILESAEPEMSFDLQDASDLEPVLTPIDEPAQRQETTVVRDNARFDPRAFAYENRVVTASAESEPCDVCVVQPNDNYWKISKRAYGTSRYFSALSLYNSNRIANPKHLRPGMKVLLPDAEVLEQKYPQLFRDSRTTRKLPTGFFVDADGAAAYRIGEQDTLSQIAQKHLGRSSRWIQIYRLNRGVLANPNKLKPGTVIALPDDATDVHMVP